MAQTKIAEALQQVNQQLDKAKQEIVNRVAALEAALLNAGEISPDVKEQLNQLKQTAQGLDDLNADPEPEPTEEPISEG